jgi:hypothetical protein
MTKPQPSSLKFLLQVDVIEELLPKIGKEQWQTLYFSAHDPSQDFTLWCGLLDGKAVASALGHDAWDLRMGMANPALVVAGPVTKK